MDVPGVRETFRDELTLLGALTLRWHTRPAGRVERHLADRPLDLEDAVVEAWAATASETPGLRAVLDRHLSAPSTPDMATAMAKASLKERELLALMAGRASGRGEAAGRAGAAIEERARATYARRAEPRRHRGVAPGLLGRLCAVLAA